MKLNNFEWEGFGGVEFEFDGLKACVIKPNCEPNGKWALKTEYFGAFVSLEKELLNRGWHIAYNQNHNRWAQDFDLKRKCEFIRFVSEEFSLNKKCALVGMSCGGLYAVKTAALVPELISVLYLDAPVINLLSYPAAFGASKERSNEFFEKTKMTLVELLSYRDHPLDKLDVLVNNNLPVIMVAGALDDVVPYAENGALLEKYYKENGADIEVYIKDNCNHHPHGLDDPAIIADFIEKY